MHDLKVPKISKQLNERYFKVQSCFNIQKGKMLIEFQVFILLLLEEVARFEKVLISIYDSKITAK